MTLFYVDPVTGLDTNNGFIGLPVKSISAGKALMTTGDELILADGTYSGALNDLTALPNGTGLAYNKIRAANVGGVVITSSFNILNQSYIELDGLKIENNLDKGVSNSNHKKKKKKRKINR